MTKSKGKDCRLLGEVWHLPLAQPAPDSGHMDWAGQQEGTWVEGCLHLFSATGIVKHPEPRAAL